MELCDHSLSLKSFSDFFAEAEVLEAMHQVCIIYDVLDVKTEVPYTKYKE